MSIFDKGLNNFLFFRKRTIFLRSYIILFLWILVRILRLKKVNLFSSNISIANGNHQEFILNRSPNKDVIYHFASFNSIKNIQSKNSFLDFVPKTDVLNLVFRCIFFDYFKLKDINIYNLVYYIEFKCIELFFVSNKFSSISVAGHFDRLTTWLSYLSKEYDVKFILYQHGCVANYKIPHKLFVSEISCFNIYEYFYFRKFILFSKPEFVSFDYKSKVEFSILYTNKKVISIVGQTSYLSKVLEVSLFLIEAYPDFHFVIYPHPSENFKDYRSLTLKYSNVEINLFTKYLNSDYLVTLFSSLVLDYIDKSYKGKVICLNLDFSNFRMAFFNMNGITVVNDLYSLKNEIN